MQRKWMIGISIVALSYLLAGTLSAQTGQPSERGPRRPLGIYAKVSISDDIAALKNAGSPTTREALNDYFNNLYMEMLGNQAISGLTVVVHWDTVNPNPPGAKHDYDWRYVDDAFYQVKLWNENRSQNEAPKTIQLIVTPGFQSPQWVLDNLQSCDGLFLDSVVEQFPPHDCGKVTFLGFSEEADHTELPIPWNPYYKDAWHKFLKALADRYGSRTEFVSIAVAGPTASSEEMIVPNDNNSPLQTQFGAFTPNDVWLWLLNWGYPTQPAYWDSDQAFIDEWNAAIDMYGTVFPGVTLIATTGSGLPSFSTTGFTIPSAFKDDCKNLTMDCAAEATILSYFSESTTDPLSAKASQTSGLEAARTGDPDLGLAGVKHLSLQTASLTDPAAQILGGAQFNTSFSDSTFHILKEGCTSTFPPDAGDKPKGCHIPSSCNPQINSAACLPVACIPQACLAPGITTEDLTADITFGNVPADKLIPREQAEYNVLLDFFKKTPGSSVFGGAPGDAPLNYMQVYSNDIEYANCHVGDTAEVLESGGTTWVSADTLLITASQTFMGIAEPNPVSPALPGPPEGTTNCP
jgi:hypothetical protein